MELNEPGGIEVSVSDGDDRIVDGLIVSALCLYVDRSEDRLIGR